MRTNTISKFSESYIKAVYPNGINDQQRAELKRAFFAGFLSSLSAISAASEQLPEHIAVRFLSECLNECQRFQTQVEKEWRTTN